MCRKHSVASANEEKLQVANTDVAQNEWEDMHSRTYIHPSIEIEANANNQWILLSAVFHHTIIHSNRKFEF